MALGISYELFRLIVPCLVGTTMCFLKTHLIWQRAHKAREAVEQLNCGQASNKSPNPRGPCPSGILMPQDISMSRYYFSKGQAMFIISIFAVKYKPLINHTQYYIFSGHHYQSVKIMAKIHCKYTNRHNIDPHLCTLFNTC